MKFLACLFLVLLQVQLNWAGITSGLTSAQGTTFSNCKIFQFEAGVYYKLYWTVTGAQIRVGLEGENAANGWIGMGIQPTPSGATAKMQNADIVMGFRNGGSPTLFDYKGPAVGNNYPTKDASQDVTLTKGGVVNGVFSIEFTRAYGATSDTTGDTDWSGTRTLIYSMNDQVGVPGSTNGVVDYTAQHQRRSFLESFSFDVPSTSCVLPTDVDPDCNVTIPAAQTFNITFPAYSVPSIETAYKCIAFTLPNNTKYQVVRFDPIVENPSVVHHIVIYACTSPVTTQGIYDCAAMNLQCTKIFYAWAVGGQPFCLPPTVGMPFGAGVSGRTYFVMQIHYNNPSLVSGIVDNSGIKLTYTSTLRTNDAGLITLGVPIPDINIPARSPYFEMANNCSSAVTSGLPFDLTVIGSFMHAHHYGRQIWTEQYRGGALIGFLGRNTNYDFNAQSILKLKPFGTIKAGDTLSTHCVWNTAASDVPVLGGESSQTEMCFNFLVYYPYIPVAEGCAGATSLVIPVSTTGQSTTATNTGTTGTNTNTGITGNSNSLSSAPALQSCFALVILLVTLLFF